MTPQQRRKHNGALSEVAAAVHKRYLGRPELLTGIQSAWIKSLLTIWGESVCGGMAPRSPTSHSCWRMQKGMRWSDKALERFTVAIEQARGEGFSGQQALNRAHAILWPKATSSVIDMPATVYPRGRVLFGMTRHLMDNVADQCQADWMFVDGKREMVAKNEVVHDAIKLNSSTGLIGMPQQTIGSGVNVRCLINPNIRVNGLIELNQASVYRTVLGNNDIAMTQGRITDQNNNGNITVEGTTAQPASIATDGVYIVRGIMYTGDTRGQAWYMDMMCEARGARDLISASALNRGGGGE